MIEISVKFEAEKAMRSLRRAGERNVPLAVAQALTATAKHLQNVQTRSLQKYLDRPTKFTQRAFAIRRANVRDFKTGSMFSRLFAKDIQAKYLRFAVYGGRRNPKGRALVVPGKRTRLNRYGNLPRNYVKRMASRDDTFSGTINGVQGLWQRTKRGNKLLVVYAPSAEYDKRYPYHEISARIVPREVIKQLNRSIKRALKARR